MKFSQKNPRNISLETLNAVFISLLQTFDKNSNVFCSKFENGEVLHVLFFQKKLSQNVPLDTYIPMLATLLNFFGQKSGLFLLKVRKW